MSDAFDEPHLTDDYKQQIHECMLKWEDDERLPDAMDAYWRGIIDYQLFVTDESADLWVDCDKNTTNKNCVPGDHLPKYMRYLEFEW